MCKYCTEDRLEMMCDDEIFVQINPYYDTPTHLMVGVKNGDFFNEHNLDIKYCPMCGKKLVGDK